MNSSIVSMCFCYFHNSIFSTVSLDPTIYHSLPQCLVFLYFLLLPHFFLFHNYPFSHNSITFPQFLAIPMIYHLPQNSMWLPQLSIYFLNFSTLPHSSSYIIAILFRHNFSFFKFYILLHNFPFYSTFPCLPNTSSVLSTIPLLSQNSPLFS